MTVVYLGMLTADQSEDLKTSLARRQGRYRDGGRVGGWKRGVEVKSYRTESEVGGRNPRRIAAGLCGALAT